MLRAKRCCGSLATSAGKTLIAFMIFSYLLDKGIVKKIMMVVPKIDLVIQPTADFTEYNNGKLVNTNPINWDKTLELWFNDPEAHKEKILVREDRKENYFFRYNTLNADYTNKCFFDFYINRDIVNTTRAKAKEGIIGAYLNREEDGEDL